MIETRKFKELCPLEASIALLLATVAADGEIRDQEPKEFVHQVKLIIDEKDELGNYSEDRILNVLINSQSADHSHPFRLSPEQVRVLADQVCDEDLQIRVINSILEIAFSDDHYHSAERELVEILRNHWGT